jgi:ABC-type amino acid transport substrate-binding protein
MNRLRTHLGSVPRSVNGGMACLALAALLCSGCGGGGGSDDSDSTALGLIQQRGFLLIATDVSYVKPGSQRTLPTRCPATARTASELASFDVDVAGAVAQQMGVEPCFVTPPFATLVAGNWNDQWDVGIDSITITTTRQQVLAFTSPYYYTEAQPAAARSSGITTLAELAGQRVCAAAGTTYALWLSGDLAGLGLPPSAILATPPPDITVVEVDTDVECGAAIAAGTASFPAYLSSDTIVAGDIDAGVPVVRVGTPVFIESLAVAVDRQSPTATDLAGTVNVLLDALRSAGTLRQLSLQWFGTDLTNPPA